MTVRVRYRIEAPISSSEDERKDLANPTWEVVTDELDEGGIRKFKLAASATDVQLAMGNVQEGKFIAIRTQAADENQDPVQVDIKKNGVGGEAWPIVPIGSTKEGHFLVSTTGVTALYATNTGSVIMDLTLEVAGAD